MHTGISTFLFVIFASFAVILPSATAQFGGSDPSLAGPYYVRGSDGRTCIYYRIRNFAIRGYNTQSLSNIQTPVECARLCNDQSWCNSFEYATDGRCNVNANDIYVPETIAAWNTAFDWDYWQLRDCVPAGTSPSTGQAPSGGQTGNESPSNPPSTLSSDPLPVPAAPGNNNDAQNGKNNAGSTNVNLSNGQNRGSQRVQMPVRNVPGFPTVSATSAPAADANGARVQNQ